MPVRLSPCFAQGAILPQALSVVDRLREEGFQAFLVGGCVRDLLLKRKPKDFDITTDALPEQVQELFRRAYLVGRRFRIAHVRVGRHVMEVTTFRSGSHKQHQVTGQLGQLLEDNLYGKRLDEDAQRRDFTINALYYDPDSHEVLDFTDGLRDLEQRQLRVIDDPETRYREDPVRMLRALRLAAKLNFQIEEKSAAPIAALAPALRQTEPERKRDEAHKLLCTGFGATAWQLMQEHRLVEILFPHLAVFLKEGEHQERAARLVQQTLEDTDRRFGAGKPITMNFLFAALLWPQVQAEQEHQEREGKQSFTAMQDAGLQALSGQSRHISIPRYISAQAQQIWNMQLRLLKYRGKPGRARKLLADHNFRAGYDLLRLREKAGEHSDGLGDWWKDFRDTHPEIVAERPPAKDWRAHRNARSRQRRPGRIRSTPRGNRTHQRKHTSV